MSEGDHLTGEGRCVMSPCDKRATLVAGAACTRTPAGDCCGDSGRRRAFATFVCSCLTLCARVDDTLFVYDTLWVRVCVCVIIFCARRIRRSDY